MTPSYKNLPGVVSSGQDLDSIVEFASQQFGAAYWSCRADAIRALAVVAHREPSRADALKTMLRQGLQTALMRKAEHGKPSTDANMLGVAACAVALGRMGATEAHAELWQALLLCRDAHFELTQCTGVLAMALAVTRDTAHTDELEAITADCVTRWEYRQAFVEQLRYALWVMREDAEDAMRTLESREAPAKLAACAALSDLNALSMRQRLAAPRDGLSKQQERGLDEVRARLERQTARPTPFDCLGWELRVHHPNEPVDEFRSLYRTLFDGASERH